MSIDPNADSKLRSPSIIIGKKGGKVTGDPGEFDEFSLSDVAPVQPPDAMFPAKPDRCTILKDGDSLFIKLTWRGREYWLEIGGNAAAKVGTISQTVNAGTDPNAVDDNGDYTHGGYVIPEGGASKDAERIFDYLLNDPLTIEVGSKVVYIAIDGQNYIIETLRDAAKRPATCLATVAEPQTVTDLYTCQTNPVAISNVRVFQPSGATFDNSEEVEDGDYAPVEAANPFEILVEPGRDILIMRNVDPDLSNTANRWIIVDPHRILAAPWYCRATVQGPSESTPVGTRITNPVINVRDAVPLRPPGAKFDTAGDAVATRKAPASFKNEMKGCYTVGQTVYLEYYRNFPGSEQYWYDPAPPRAWFKVTTAWMKNAVSGFCSATALRENEYAPQNTAIWSITNTTLPLWPKESILLCEWKGQWEVVGADCTYWGKVASGYPINSGTDPVNATHGGQVTPTGQAVSEQAFTGSLASGETIAAGKEVAWRKENGVNLIFNAECD